MTMWAPDSKLFINMHDPHTGESYNEQDWWMQINTLYHLRWSYKMRKVSEPYNKTVMRKYDNSFTALYLDGGDRSKRK